MAGSTAYDYYYKACFHVIAISLISDADYSCTHYCLWRLPQCVLHLCSMTHYDIIIWVITLLEAPVVTSQWVMTLRRTSIVMSQ